MTNVVTLSSTTTLEGGTVIKFSAASSQLTVAGPLVCKTAPYRFAMFTAKDDNTVGETITGSSGTPTNAYGTAYVVFNSPASAVTMDYVRMSFGTYGWAVSGKSGHLLRHSQFEQCATPIYLSSATGAVQNVLIHKVSANAFLATTSRITGENITVSDANQLFSGGTLLFTDSLFVYVTNWGGGFTGYNNATNSTGGVFQSVGAGFHYLAVSSTNRNAGTTNISSTLLTALRQKTTYPPLLLTNTISASTNLAVGAARDTNAAAVDRGYHYDPIDYVVSNCTVSAGTLTLSNGLALTCYNADGFKFTSGGLNCVGTPVSPVRFVKYSAVQERSLALGAVGNLIAPVIYNHPSVSIRFTDFACGGNYVYTDNGDTYFGSLTVTNCAFHGGSPSFGGTGYYGITLANNLFENSSINAGGGTLSLSFCNNLCKKGSYYIGGTNAIVRDNSFDNCTLWNMGTAPIHDHNAYINTAAGLGTTNGTDIGLTNFLYTNGPLGNYYQVSTNLVDKGSLPADDAGLYHYTTRTNQVKETNSWVDIGFHYVALTNGSPFDTDGDGVADYLDPDSTPTTDIVWSNTVWSWKPRSLAWNCWTNALACTNGATGDFTNIFVYTPTNIIRNTNFWMRNFKGWPAYSLWNNCETNLWPNHTDLTCLGTTPDRRAGVLVSPEHILLTGHHPFPTNHWLAFMDTNNAVVFRQVKDYFCNICTTSNTTTNMPTASFGDYYLGLLDQPVSSNIGYVKVIPTNWWAWFDAPFQNTTNNFTYHVPIYTWNCQHHTPWMKDLVSLTCYTDYISSKRWMQYTNLTLTNWNHAIANGDSGSPTFFTLDGELCLATIVSSSVDFGVESPEEDPAYLQASLNAAMRELSLRNGRTNIYTLTVKDLSNYPIYHPSFNCPP